MKPKHFGEALLVTNTEGKWWMVATYLVATASTYYQSLHMGWVNATVMYGLPWLACTAIGRLKGRSAVGFILGVAGMLGILVIALIPSKKVPGIEL